MNFFLVFLWMFVIYIFKKNNYLIIGVVYLIIKYMYFCDENILYLYKDEYCKFL